MIPFVAAGIGLLVGAGVMYIFEEKDKDAIKTAIGEADRAQQRMQDRLKEAKQREVQLRGERISLVLQWSKSRLETLLAKNEAPLMQLQRVWATGKALQRIADAIPASGELNSAEQTFVDLVLKAQRGDVLTRVDRAQVDDYLATTLGDTMRDFLEDRIASALKVHNKRLRILQDELITTERDLRTARMRLSVEAGRSGVGATAIAQLEDRGAQLKQDIDSTRRLLQEAERNIVVVARLTRPDEAKDEYDRIAERILERVVRNELLSDEDWEFLSAYRDMYFLPVREILRARRGIDLADMVAA
ncbi:MAG: hypothetical protein IPF99_09120 [Deltaproteobacteria bacterium]|jgi:hypothetical protein|nr:hypothetical protein [Deltaproteobacteria bacterium]MBP6832760.1 hypothetical protein [Deltaproteobacteria bacterium]